MGGRFTEKKGATWKGGMGKGNPTAASSSREDGKMNIWGDRRRGEKGGGAGNLF